MSMERTTGKMPVAVADETSGTKAGSTGSAESAELTGSALSAEREGGAGFRPDARGPDVNSPDADCQDGHRPDDRRPDDRRQNDRRQDDRRRDDRQLRAALPLAVEAARAMVRRVLPDQPDMTAACAGDSAGSGGSGGAAGSARTRCCTCGSRDVWLLHDGVLHLVGCRRCGRTGPGALSAPLAVEVWNSAEESRFCRGLPPDAEMMAPCVCEAPPPDAGLAVSHPAHLRPLGSQVMPAPVRVHRLSPYGAQLSGQCDPLCQWLEGTEGTLCELALPMADGKGWTLFALRVESARREGDDLFVGGGFVRQGERQRGLLARLLDVAALAVEEDAQESAARMAAN